MSINEAMKEVLIKLANPKETLLHKELKAWGAKIQTPELVPEEGWVFREHIEGRKDENYPLSPYGSPTGHRHKYLPSAKKGNELIEHRTFVYVVKKPNQKNTNVYREPVYRLSSSPKAQTFLRKNLSSDLRFLTSKYSERVIGKNQDYQIVCALHALLRLYEGKVARGSWGTNDKDFFEAMLDHIQVAEKDIKHHLARSRKYTEKEKNEEHDRRNIESLSRLHRISLEEAKHLWNQAKKESRELMRGRV